MTLLSDRKSKCTVLQCTPIHTGVYRLYASMPPTGSAYWRDWVAIQGTGWAIAHPVNMIEEALAEADERLL